MKLEIPGGKLCLLRLDAVDDAQLARWETWLDPEKRAQIGRQDAQRALGQRELRRPVRHADVTGHRQLQTAAVRAAADRADHRHRQRGDAVEDAVAPSAHLCTRLRIPGQELVDIRPGAENLRVGAADHDGAQLGHVLQRIQQPLQILQQPLSDTVDRRRV